MHSHTNHLFLTVPFTLTCNAPLAERYAKTYVQAATAAAAGCCCCWRCNSVCLRIDETPASATRVRSVMTLSIRRSRVPSPSSHSPLPPHSWHGTTTQQRTPAGFLRNARLRFMRTCLRWLLRCGVGAGCMLNAGYCKGAREREREETCRTQSYSRRPDVRVECFMFSTTPHQVRKRANNKHTPQRNDKTRHNEEFCSSSVSVSSASSSCFTILFCIIICESLVVTLMPLQTDYPDGFGNLGRKARRPTYTESERIRR